MTFHDELEHAYEMDAYQSVRHLQLWLSTIAPLKGELCESILKELYSLCVLLDWTLEYDKDLGRSILEKVPRGEIGL